MHHNFLEYSIVAIAAWAFIATKAFQQLNVGQYKWGWVIPTSYAMQFVEVFYVASIAKNGWSLPFVAITGAGAGLGSITSMWLHKKFQEGEFVSKIMGSKMEAVSKWLGSLGRAKFERGGN